MIDVILTKCKVRDLVHPVLDLVHYTQKRCEIFKIFQIFFKIFSKFFQNFKIIFSRGLIVDYNKYFMETKKKLIFNDLAKSKILQKISDPSNIF